MPVSSNGRWVVWKYGGVSNFGHRNVKTTLATWSKRTIAFGGTQTRFETMSSDGSKIFFVETKGGASGDLYMLNTETDTQTDLTADHGTGERSAGVQEAVMGASEDGSMSTRRYWSAGERSREWCRQPLHAA